jgi:hypothetical protein
MDFRINDADSVTLISTQAADVQAELQQYLNSKNINSLFISIVENLLIEKPANPIAFMIEYLYKQYPEQAKPAIESLSSSNTGYVHLHG